MNSASNLCRPTYFCRILVPVGCVIVPPRGKHKCDNQSRRDHLFIPIRTPAKAGTTRLRILVYFSKNLVQSQLLTAEVSDKPQLGSGYSSSIDYSLTASLQDVSFLPQRSVNIMTNPDSVSAHQLVINSGLNEAIILNPTEGKVKAALEEARKALSDIHFKVFGGQLGGPRPVQTCMTKTSQVQKKTSSRISKASQPLGYKLYDSSLFTRQGPTGRIEEIPEAS